MSHPEQRLFFEEALRRVSAVSSEIRRVLEIGAYDVNGEVRGLFSGLDDYVGVDLVEGPGVDVVSYGHELGQEYNGFDAVVAAETFEHDQYWVETFRRMVEAAVPGGWVIVTCASLGRPEHGTERADLDKSPGTANRGLNYYKNISRTELYDEAIKYPFVFFQAVYMPWSFDLYFWGKLESNADTQGINFDTLRFEKKSLVRISRVMPLAQKIVRLPIMAMVKIFRNQDTLNEAVHLYWKNLGRLSRSLGFRHLESRPFV